MRLFLIDGHALVFKMYYAFLGRPMVNSRGEDTSILYGFTKYLLELINKEHPTHIAVSFDPPGGTFRNELYPAYKANRGETPVPVIQALEPLIQMVSAMNIPVLMIPGFEADDVIGSAAVRFASDDTEVYMVTPDKDYGQLVSSHIFQFRPGKSGAENELWGEAEVCAKWDIEKTSQVIDMLALCGDSSDNVPGVAGVGPKGAAKLLAKYGSVEGIYEHLDELSPKQREKFEEAEPHMALSKKLVTIKTDVPVDATMDSMIVDTTYTSDLEALLDRHEFPSLKKLVRTLAANSSDCLDCETKAFESAPLQRVEPSCVNAKRVACVLDGEQLYVTDGTSYASGSPVSMRTLMESPDVVKVGYGLKSMMNRLSGEGISLCGRLEDLEIMHYLIDPEHSHKPEDLVRLYIGEVVQAGSGAVEEEPSLFGADDSFMEGGESLASSDTLTRLSLVLPVAEKIEAELAGQPALGRLYDNMEEPLIGVLSRMELAGVKVDIASLEEFARGLEKQMKERESQIRSIAGDPSLNVASPKQIGELVFEKLSLDPKARKPKKGNWPTDEQTLQELSDRSPVIEAILDYRGLRKLLSTYIEPFGTYVSKIDGRVHTTFNQALTATGRLSSSNPNLQNIPIRSEQGREIRKAFVPGSEDNVLMSADYSQIELRLMAHFSGDEHLVSAFRQGQDVHRATASKIFGVALDEVTEQQRRVAKTVNFGIIYGISPFGLAQRLHCSRSEAKRIIDDYFESFPSVRRFISETVEKAGNDMYVETLFGRRRYIPEIKSANGALRAFAERNAVNAPVQGTAADIIKLAMIAVDRRLRKEGLKSVMVLQIHDELLLDVPHDETDVVERILKEEMEGVVTLSVPLTIECNYGKNWLDAH